MRYFDTEIKKVGVSFKDLPQFLIELSRQSQAWDPNTFHTLETLFDCPYPRLWFISISQVKSTRID